MARSLKGTLHAHGCIRCHLRYQDACRQHTEDGLCTSCRGGKAWQLLIDNASPKDCCTATARLVTKDERSSYRLAGAHVWFICATCKRTHPFDPKSSIPPSTPREEPPT
jgi:hypothetical protein